MKLRLHVSEHIKKQELKFLPLFLIFQLMVKWQKIDIAFNLETIPNPLTLTYQDKANNQNTENTLRPELEIYKDKIVTKWIAFALLTLTYIYYFHFDFFINSKP